MSLETGPETVLASAGSSIGETTIVARSNLSLPIDVLVLDVHATRLLRNLDLAHALHVGSYVARIHAVNGHRLSRRLRSQKRSQKILADVSVAIERPPNARRARGLACPRPAQAYMRRVEQRRAAHSELHDESRLLGSGRGAQHERQRCHEA
jgi:hypothetical protein